jgi:hypothetical protein
MAAPLNTPRLDIWIWALIYAGLVVGGVGLAVRPSSAALGWPIAIVGASMIAVGALLVWVRSRMNTDKPAKKIR